jgi:histidinol dehydrogenase
VIIIQGFETAYSVLSRRPSFESLPLSPKLREDIKEVFGRELTLEQVVEEIIAEVQRRGDAALMDYTSKFDGVQLTSLEVSREEIEVAYKLVDEELVSALKLATQRIGSFHLTRKRDSGIDLTPGGVGQMVCPLAGVGIYVPGGTACYPSTVLMTAVPARVAGVGEVILVTPPRQMGLVSAATLVAADIARDIARVVRIFKLGGAQAIAALAFGTETVPRVDKICGPGNIFVVLAKKMVYGFVDIDGLQGPSELVIVADESADPVLCAADLLAQAEHDPLASAILITTSAEIAAKVNQETTCQARMTGRQAAVAESLENRGMIIVVGDMDEAINLVNLYAPEHLSLMVRDGRSYIEKIRNAGCIFIGKSSAAALGDYIAGPSHVLPTGGTARFSSPLGVDDFFKVTSLVDLPGGALKELGSAAATIARAEGFDAHAHSLELRLQSGEETE